MSRVTIQKKNKYLEKTGQKSIIMISNGFLSILRPRKPGYEQRGVISSKGCKKAVIENMASNMMKGKEKRDITEP